MAWDAKLGHQLIKTLDLKHRSERNPPWPKHKSRQEEVNGGRLEVTLMLEGQEDEDGSVEEIEREGPVL